MARINSPAPQPNFVIFKIRVEVKVDKVKPPLVPAVRQAIRVVALNSIALKFGNPAATNATLDVSYRVLAVAIRGGYRGPLSSELVF